MSIVKSRRFFWLLAGCLVWVACTTNPGYTVTGRLVGDVPPPANGKAMLVFVRPYSFFVKMNYEIFDGDQIIAAGQPTGSCHLYEAEPGTHMFSGAVVAGTGMQEGIAKRRFALLPADIAEGKTYYVLVRQWSMDVAGYGIEMRPISRRVNFDMQKLNEWLVDCKLVEPGPEAHAWMEQHREAIRAQRASYQRRAKSPPEHFLRAEDGFSDGKRPLP